MQNEVLNGVEKRIVDSKTRLIRDAYESEFSISTDRSGLLSLLGRACIFAAQKSHRKSFQVGVSGHIRTKDDRGGKYLVPKAH